MKEELSCFFDLPVRRKWNWWLPVGTADGLRVSRSTDLLSRDE